MMIMKTLSTLSSKTQRTDNEKQLKTLTMDMFDGHDITSGYTGGSKNYSDTSKYIFTHLLDHKISKYINEEIIDGDDVGEENITSTVAKKRKDYLKKIRK